MPTTKTRTPADALADAREAQASANSYTVQADSARAEAARIDADAVDLIVSDPAQADRITREVSTQERLANAYTAKAGAERARADKLARDALALEAERLDKAAEKAVKDAAAHQERVDELLAQLEDLDGVSYGVAAVPLAGAVDGRTYYPSTRGEQMTEHVDGYRVRASTIRYFLAHNELPEQSTALDVIKESDPMAGRPIVQAREFFIPPLLAAYLAGTILEFTPEA